MRNPSDGESPRRGFGNLLRPIVVIPVVLVVFGAAVWFGVQSAHGSSNNSGASTTQTLYTVSPTTMSETISTSGEIQPANTEDLSFGVSGTVTAVNVKAGQAVKKGQVLATINSADLASQVAQAQASLATAQAQLTSDQNAGASSEQIDLDNANVASAFSSVATAQQNLAGASLTSPVDGTVSVVNLTVGQVLNSSGGSGTNLTGTGTGSGRNNSTGSTSSGTGLGNNNSNSSSNSSSTQVEVISNALVVNLGVDTTQIGNVKVGDAATITPSSSSGNSTSNVGGGRFFFGGGGGGLGGFGGGGAGGSGRGTTGGTGSTGSQSTATAAAAPGTVTSVGAIASTSSGVATFPVVVTVTGTPTGFHAGANASVVITYHELTNVLAVPATALNRSNGTTTVTVSDNGHTSQKSVTTGLTTGGQVQITSGLQSGDQVVVTIPTLRRGTTGTNGTNGTRTGFGGGGGFGGGEFGGFGGRGGGSGAGGGKGG